MEWSERSFEERIRSASRSRASNVAVEASSVIIEVAVLVGSLMKRPV